MSVWLILSVEADGPVLGRGPLLLLIVRRLDGTVAVCFTIIGVGALRDGYTS